jgi:hypothetical protein
VHCAARDTLPARGVTGSLSPDRGAQRARPAGGWLAARVNGCTTFEGLSNPEHAHEEREHLRALRDDLRRGLYLRGRLAAARAEAGRGGSLHRAFALLSRAAAAGSGDALDALEDAARSWECERRRLAARALADSGSRSALSALRTLAEAEPPPADAVDRLKRLLGAEGSCGAGDIARDGIREIEGEGK